MFEDETLTAGQEIDRCPSDYARAQYCRARSERYRNEWFQGQRETVAYVRQRAALGDVRFAGISPDRLEITGKGRWARTVKAKDLQGLEQMYTRWAQMYLAFADFRLPGRHVGAVAANSGRWGSR